MANTVTPAVRSAAAWSWRLLAIAGAVAVALWLVAVLKVIVVPVAIALLVTIALRPVVEALTGRLHLPRPLAVGVTVVGLLALLAGLVVAAGSSVANGIVDLWSAAKDGFVTALTWLAEGPLHISSAQLDGYLAQLQQGLSGMSSQLLTGAVHATTTVGHVGAGTLIAIFCLIFFLLDGRTIWTWVVGLFPQRAREQVHQAGRRGWLSLEAYTRTQVLVAAVDAIGIGVGAAILGVPLALPLGVLVFLGSFVPIVGALVTGAVAVLVALVSHGLVAAVWMLVIVLAVQQVEGHVLQPFLMGHAVSLHPVAVLLSVAAGSLVAGIVGALFAVPIAALTNTVVLYLHGHDKFPHLGTDDHLVHRRQATPDAGEDGTGQPGTEGPGTTPGSPTTGSSQPEVTA
ncbi:AI-2E family transporter [Cellulomonas citrea]|uniref:AI-2E family transporter n=1 Tax=Cellulomonas citrea TaxID=1909423 RepID=UPI00135ABF48|nr:AI-2E family transporter [Cellulomonas citrea]